MSTHRAVCALAVMLIGCAGRYGGKPVSKAKAPSGGLEAAALPYQVVDARTGRQIETPAFWTQLGKERAICIGEDHSNPHQHWAQLEIVKQLAQRKPATERLALGLEMVQRPFQGVLDDFSAKRIDAAALRSRTGWEDRWGYDYGFYGATFDAAVAAGGQLLALNAARELTKKVSHKGLDALTPTERAQIPELDLTNAVHRAWFDALMEGMGGTSAHSRKPETEAEPDNPHEAAPPMPSADQIYAVQVIWDESMADGAYRWLTANPTGLVIILAGNGHCHDSAIVGRIKRRGVAAVVSIHPVLDTDASEVLAQPINDFAFVLQTTPEMKAKMAADDAATP
ncbi:MAG: ChaN family lipoprotein [Myxococcales bacterium]|nr:ChaN family lipoprotein [Myxococcales bacterium]